MSEEHKAVVRRLVELRAREPFDGPLTLGVGAQFGYNLLWVILLLNGLLIYITLGGTLPGAS